MLALTPVAVTCAAGNCPTIYASDRGTFVVQGYQVSVNEVEHVLPAGEQMVEIPQELLLDVVRGLELKA
ncbi:hypothetical protein Val02_57960 [Virgisporangium aliadipatigenens]|uniref:Uncharacterized protein n=2 Tax=Virgisporangium aliadipatigenens TaxID=741659 RepID=A0A8J4DS70_9ACTN|nr:hypothetical protein Val02_57960 [Virgisporangium aliadipatigenens]